MFDVRIRKRQGDFSVDAAFLSKEVGITALFGRSGAGKTSVINMLAGLVRPDEGHIIVNEGCLFDSSKGIDIPPQRRRIGYVFQDGRLFPHLSVRSNLVYGMRLTRPSERYLRFDQIVELLGIGQLLDRQPAKLSGGEKQRIAIGRALLASPSLLLMDEPLASLDRARKTEVLPFIARMSDELSIPILYVSHSVNEILNLADGIVVMESGRVAAAGRIEDLMNRIDLQGVTGVSHYGAVITTVVEKHLDTLTYLRFPGGLLKVPRFDLPKRTKTRVRIQAGNVGIALVKPSRTTIQNILPGTIEKIHANRGPLVDVRLDVGVPLLARITAQAKKDLDLEPGKQVFALVKSVAVSRGDVEPEEE
jgi:molybdate transport system ATP-binding protein